MARFTMLQGNSPTPEIRNVDHFRTRTDFRRFYRGGYMTDIDMMTERRRNFFVADFKDSVSLQGESPIPIGQSIALKGMGSLPNFAVFVVFDDSATQTVQGIVEMDESLPFAVRPLVGEEFDALLQDWEAWAECARPGEKYVPTWRRKEDHG